MTGSMTSATITARLDEESSRRLDALARATDRSRSFLVAEAVRRYLTDEAWQVEAVMTGLAAAEAGDFATEEETETFFDLWASRGR